MSTPSVHAQSIAQVFESLKSSPRGLSGKEAKARQKIYGANVLPRAGEFAPRVHIFFSQWKSPLILILLAAALISFFLGERIDATIIGVTALVNALIGFVQEDKANQALKKLRAIVTYHAFVLRDGEKQQLPSEDIVPGDIVFLSAGDTVQADGRISAAVDFLVSEAPLTGESEPVKKHGAPVAETAPLGDRASMVYRGTSVTNGEAIIVVTAIGKDTEIGRIASLVQETTEDPTPLQMQLGRLASLVGRITLGIAAALMAFGWFFGQGRYAALEIFQTAVAVAVAAIPEGLVISLTVILSIGMQHILKRRALVRRLVAAETLGSVSVICTDKTGTLTEGRMAVTELVTANQQVEDGGFTAVTMNDPLHHEDALLALRIGVLCNNAAHSNPEAEEAAWQLLGDTTETALLRTAARAGIVKSHMDEALPRLAEIPFTSERRYMATLHRVDHERMIYVKGAPEALLARAVQYEDGDRAHLLTEKKQAWFVEETHRLARQGLRTLALAYRVSKASDDMLVDKDIRDLVLVGIVGLSDPIRSDVKTTMAIAKRAGIRVIMLTGDHAQTAEFVARSLGILENDRPAADGQAIDRSSDAALGALLAESSVFARVNPRHKLRIVRALQAQGEVVAVTGDGVNDAPALKAADIGVALGSGTDVAKETADVVLLDDSFTTIVAAVEEGRRMYQNIKKIILYLLASSLAEVVLIAGSILGGLPLALLPAQILWVNIIVDTFPTIALAFDAGEKETMREAPRKKDTSLFDREAKILITIISIVSNVVLFGLFLFFLSRSGQNLAYVRTLMFVGLGMGSLLYIYAVRSMRRHFWQMRMFDNQYLTSAVVFGLALLVVAVYASPLQILLHTVALSPWDWGVMGAFGVFNVFLIEIVKHIFFINQKKTSYA